MSTDPNRPESNDASASAREGGTVDTGLQSEAETYEDLVQAATTAPIRSETPTQKIAPSESTDNRSSELISADTLDSDSDDALDAHLRTMDSDSAEDAEQPAQIIVHGKSKQPTLPQDFELTHKLGEGGMGEVWGADAADLQREVAIKVLSRSRKSDVEAHARFEREANITAQLAHPNVIPVYAKTQTQDGLPAFTMKWVKGLTLFSYLKKCREEELQSEISEERSLAARLDLFIKVCDAIAYSHDVGIIHRDLKPSNFMIGDFNEIYVMDWGMARRLSDDHHEQRESGPPSSQDLSATMAGAVMGTPMYMAPEQALGQSENVGPESDQFALGLILFALCTLRPARKAPSVAEMLQLAQSAPPITFKRGEVPPGLRAIIRKATAFEPGERYKSVKRLAADVRRFVRGRRVKAHRETLTQRIRRIIQNYPSATLSVMLLALVIGLVSAAAGLYQAFETEKKARLRESKLVHRISTVNQTAQNAERYLLRLQSLQMAVAESVQLRLQQRRNHPITAVHETEFGTIEGGRFVPLPTSVTPGAQMRTSWMVADNGDKQRAHRELRYLGQIAVRFRQAMLHAIDPKLARSALNDEQVIRRLMEENSVKYLYIGLESGLLLNFPGITLPKGYDPRKRPWYRGSMLTQFTSWGSIYPDASGSGYLVPCNSVVRDLDGKIVGVVGLDISANQLLDLVNKLKLPQLAHLMLVNRRGNIVLQSTDRGLRTMATNADNKARRGVPIQIKELERIAKEGQKTGALQVDGVTYVHAPLPALRLMLIAKLKI